MAALPARTALPARAVALMALLAALVLAQALGWMHRALHGDAGLPGAAATAQANGHGHAKAPLAGLFRHDAGSVDCKLLDLLAQPACAGAQAEPPPPARAAAALPAPAAAPWVAQATAFDARAPPRFR